MATLPEPETTTRLPSRESPRWRSISCDEEGGAVAGGLLADRATPPHAEALAGQHAGLVAVGDPLVLAEQVADLAAAHADVARGHVGVLPEVAVELGHEGLAEPHDLGVGAALGVEVRPALAAADRHAGERVLEDLLEAEELHDAEVDAGVEPQAALVGPERGVELDPEAAVDLHLAPVVDPRHPEDDLPLRLADPLDHPGVGVLRVPGRAPGRGCRAPRARPGGTPARPGCAGRRGRRSRAVGDPGRSRPNPRQPLGPDRTASAS